MTPKRRLLHTALWALSGTVLPAAADELDRSLLSPDPQVRAEARRYWADPAVTDLGPLDLRRDPCADTQAAPADCGVYSRRLAAVLELLSRRAAREAAEARVERPARDLLWSWLADPAVQVFGSSALPRERARTLHRQAQQALRAAMALPAAPTLAQAQAQAVASAAGDSLQWLVLQSCAGSTQYAGCRFGSYLFDARGRLLAQGLIEPGAPDNPGAGIDEWHLQLTTRDDRTVLGAALTRGGFGGDLDRVLLRVLRPGLRALCGFSSARVPSGPSPAELLQAVDFVDGRCRWGAVPAGATRVDFRLAPPQAPRPPVLPAPTPR